MHHGTFKQSLEWLEELARRVALLSRGTASSIA
jgi:hypothetical protein